MVVDLLECGWLGRQAVAEVVEEVLRQVLERVVDLLAQRGADAARMLGTLAQQRGHAKRLIVERAAMEERVEVQERLGIAGGLEVDADGQV